MFIRCRKQQISMQTNPSYSCKNAVFLFLLSVVLRLVCGKLFCLNFFNKCLYYEIHSKYSSLEVNFMRWFLYSILWLSLFTENKLVSPDIIHLFLLVFIYFYLYWPFLNQPPKYKQKNVIEFSLIIFKNMNKEKGIFIRCILWLLLMVVLSNRMEEDD